VLFFWGEGGKEEAAVQQYTPLWYAPALRNLTYLSTKKNTCTYGAPSPQMASRRPINCPIRWKRNKRENKKNPFVKKDLPYK
jgi:hypothetical protein